MDDLKSVYKELTSVDIEEQKTLWDERAKGYYGEYLLLSHLYPCIDGRSKILMNINIPINTGKSTEIDLLMIHESGLYAFEVKNYKGTIAGIICAVVIGLAIMVIGSFQLKVNEARKAQDIAEKKFAVYEKKFADFEQKFKEVKPLNGGDVTLEDNFFEVIDYSFKESKDFKDTIIFSCKIQVNGEYYGLRIHRNSSIIVQLKDGSVLEYSFSNTSRTFPDTTVASFAPAWYNNTAELPQVYIYTSSIDNISYIKLTNVTVNTQGNMLSNALPGIEFELYSAN